LNKLLYLCVVFAFVSCTEENNGNETQPTKESIEIIRDTVVEKSIDTLVQKELPVPPPAPLKATKVNKEELDFEDPYFGLGDRIKEAMINGEIPESFPRKYGKMTPKDYKKKVSNWLLNNQELVKPEILKDFFAK